MDHIAATLGLKEMSQSVLMRKICTLSGHHRTRKAIFEFDKLIRSIYTLRYLRDPQLQRDEAMRSCGIAAQTLMVAAKAMEMTPVEKADVVLRICRLSMEIVARESRDDRSPCPRPEIGPPAEAHSYSYPSFSR